MEITGIDTQFKKIKRADRFCEYRRALSPAILGLHQGWTTILLTECQVGSGIEN
jgi:hypothetical protein